MKKIRESQVKDMRVLMWLYNEFFTEPEQDGEWNEYQSK